MCIKVNNKKIEGRSKGKEQKEDDIDRKPRKKIEKKIKKNANKHFI